MKDFLTHLDNSRLHLIILPTEQCNLRCSYCYEDFSVGKISDDIVKSIKLLIDRRANELRYLEIGWFGGEPLLYIDPIEEIGNYAQLCGGKHGFAYRSSISTNGVLLDLIKAQRIIDAGVNVFQISLDGNQENHDLTRKTFTGKPTFKKIWKNLISLRDSNLIFELAFRIHLSKENLDSIYYLIENIKKKFGGDSRFKIYFKAIENLGGNGSKFAKSITIDNTEEVIKEMENMLPHDMLVENFRSSPDVCYAAAGNSFVIRANGDIVKCTVALNSKTNIIGKLNLDGTMDLDTELFKLWVSHLFVPDAAKCPLQSIEALHFV